MPSTRRALAAAKSDAEDSVIQDNTMDVDGDSEVPTMPDKIAVPDAREMLSAVQATTTGGVTLPAIPSSSDNQDTDNMSVALSVNVNELQLKTESNTQAIESILAKQTTIQGSLDELKNNVNTLTTNLIKLVRKNTRVANVDIAIANREKRDADAMEQDDGSTSASDAAKPLTDAASELKTLVDNDALNRIATVTTPAGKLPPAYRRN